MGAILNEVIGPAFKAASMFMGDAVGFLHFNDGMDPVTVIEPQGKNEKHSGGCNGGRAIAEHRLNR